MYVVPYVIFGLLKVLLSFYEISLVVASLLLDINE